MVIHHVQLAAPAECESTARKFYGDLLGLKEIAKPPELAKRGGVWFALGASECAQELHIGVEVDFYPARKAHPAFRVTDLDALRSKFERAGYPTTSDDLFSDYLRFYVSDPFGNRLEFLQIRNA